MGVRRGVRRAWRQHKLGLLAVLALAALGLGFAGYLNAHDSVVNALYGTLSLLALNFYPPKSRQIPWTLEVARFMVPAVAAFATFTALAALLEDQWHLVRARARRDHVVVCGLGRRGMRLVRALRAGDRPSSVVAVETEPADPNVKVAQETRDRALSVVAVEADRANPNVKLARQLGAIVVVGDSTEAEVLQAAGVQRAETLVSVLPEDADNAAVASVARELCRKRVGRLDAYCHVADMDLVEDLTSAEVETVGEDLREHFVLEWFSVSERAARLLLSEHAELVNRSKEGGPPHLVVVGTDDLARAIVVHAARQWRAIAGAGAEPLRITVAWEGAQEWLDRLAERHPLDGVASLNPYEHDLGATGRVDARKALDDATAVFVCAPSDTESLELGFAASRVLSGGKTVIVRLLIEKAGFIELLGGERDTGFRLFSIVDRACSLEMVTDGLNEALARALHGIYLSQKTKSDASVPWEDLADTYQQSSRAQARDVSAKLRGLGCGIRQIGAWDSPLLELDEEEVKPLAKDEHERWNQWIKDRGWVWGPKKDPDAQPPTNNWIDVNWEDLPDDVAGYDLDFVRELPKVFAAAGYELYRKNETSNEVETTAGGGRS